MIFQLKLLIINNYQRKQQLQQLFSPLLYILLIISLKAFSILFSSQILVSIKLHLRKLAFFFPTSKRTCLCWSKSDLFPIRKKIGLLSSFNKDITCSTQLLIFSKLASLERHKLLQLHRLFVVLDSFLKSLVLELENHVFLS